MTDHLEQTKVPPLAELKVVVDPTLPRDELHVHPAMFDLLQRAFMEADIMRGFRREPGNFW